VKKTPLVIAILAIALVIVIPWQLRIAKARQGLPTATVLSQGNAISVDHAGPPWEEFFSIDPIVVGKMKSILTEGISSDLLLATRPDGQGLIRVWNYDANGYKHVVWTVSFDPQKLHKGVYREDFTSLVDKVYGQRESSFVTLMRVLHESSEDIEKQKKHEETEREKAATQK